MQAQGVIPTSSPSMDIQVSSNFERFLFALWGGDTERLRAAMKEFRERGAFDVPAGDLARAQGDFLAARASEEETQAAMALVYQRAGIMIDPHTAVGVHVALRAADKTRAPLVALATAHPAKFPAAVQQATGAAPPVPVSLCAVMALPERMQVLPNSLAAVKDYIDRADA